MSHVAIIGKGAIAQALLPLLPQAGVTDVTLLVRDASDPSAQDVARQFPGRCRVVDSLTALLAGAPDLVVEAAGQSAVEDFGADILRAGVPLIAASVGALADAALTGSLREAAQNGGAQLHVPAGAIGGIDALAAFATTGEISLTYTGTKPPQAWPAGSPTNGIVFEGSAGEAARCFPKNANVAATLALAGPGLDATRVTLAADPEATGNTHSWTAIGPAGEISVRIHSAPVAGNAATSLLTVHSLLRAVRNATTEVSL